MVSKCKVKSVLICIIELNKNLDEMKKLKDERERADKNNIDETIQYCDVVVEVVSRYALLEDRIKKTCIRIEAIRRLLERSRNSNR